MPLAAGLLHYQFVTIHPFYDGNGRTARLAATLVMRRYGYGLKGVYALEEYYARDPAAYYAAVAAHPHHNYYFGRAGADLTNWLDYFCTGVAEAFEKVKKVADAERKRGGRDKNNQLRELDSRQRLALTLFARQQNITAAELARCWGFLPAMPPCSAESGSMPDFCLWQTLPSGRVNIDWLQNLSIWCESGMGKGKSSWHLVIGQSFLLALSLASLKNFSLAFTSIAVCQTEDSFRNTFTAQSQHLTQL
ncbi:hypothetical protein AGMMS49974_03820 [Deltaproteobacteria bacterium]|nr:hypothetical protein AGMMS49974_03820 [Deltaproteobacteria bacterium]